MAQWLSYPTFSGPFSGQEQLLAASSTSPGAGMIRIPWSAVSGLITGTGFLPLTGGTLTGPLTLPGNATLPLQAVPLQQVEAITGGPFLQLAGGTLTGPLTLAADPTVALGAATKEYVDGAVAGGSFLPLTGGTVSGPIVLPGNATLPLQAVPLQQVTSIIGGPYLPLGGGTLTGALVLAANPTLSLGAATKQYVDAAVVSGPFLPLAGGTVTGATTFSADVTFSGASTGLAVSNNATVGGTFVATGGINGTPVGAVTPSTGSFTNLAASGTVTLPSTTTGPFLLLTGGTVSGPTTFSSTLAASGGGSVAGTFSGTPTWSGLHTFDGGVTLPNGTPGISAPQYNTPGNTFTGTSNAIPPRLNLNLNLAGTVSGLSYVNYLTVTSDSANALLGSNGGLFTLGIVHNVTGTATVNGGRGLIWGQLNVGAITAPALEMLGMASSIFVTGNTNGAFAQPLTTQVGLSSAASVANTVAEMGLKCAAGSSVDGKGFLIFTYNPGDAVAGSVSDTGLSIASANPAGTSPGCGMFLSIGRVGQGFPMAATTGTIIGSTQQVNNGGSNRNIHFIPPQCFAGIDFGQVDFTQASGVAFRSPAFSVDGGGQISTGNATITQNGTGIAIDIPNQIVTAAVVAAGGGGGGSGIADYYVGDILFDGNGGLYRVATVSSGAVATVTILTSGVAASPPSNPVATTGGSGVNCTLTLTWAARNTLALQPSGGLVKLGSGCFTANASTALALTNVGPAGAHSTVQEWLTITDSAGTVRYIPCF